MSMCIHTNHLLTKCLLFKGDYIRFLERTWLVSPDTYPSAGLPAFTGAVNDDGSSYTCTVPGVTVAVAPGHS